MLGIIGTVLLSVGIAFGRRHVWPFVDSHAQWRGENSSQLHRPWEFPAWTAEQEIAAERLALFP
jgi:hypothetical protein